MKLYNCVMLGLMSSGLSPVHSKILNDYSQFVNLEKIKECGWKSLVENDPHVTLIYGLTPGVGYNTLYHTLKIKNRAEHLKLKAGRVLHLTNPVIDTFNNEDAKVLKINFNGCTEYEDLKAMMTKLAEIPNDWQYLDNYNPHLTLTYLNPDAPDSIAQSLTEKYAPLLSEFTITGYIISSDDDINQPERFS